MIMRTLYMFSNGKKFIDFLRSLFLLMSFRSFKYKIKIIQN
jgi:hypothetical protein